MNEWKFVISKMLKQFSTVEWENMVIGINTKNPALSKFKGLKDRMPVFTD